jgi:hypothetical protein
MKVGGQFHAPAALPPGKRPGTHCIEGWVGPRAGLDGCRKSRPHPDSIPGGTEGKKRPWKPRSGCEDNIRLELKELVLRVSTLHLS